MGGPPFFLSAGNNPSNNANDSPSLPRGPLESGDEVDSWRRAVAVGMRPGDVSFHHCVRISRCISMLLVAYVCLPQVEKACLALKRNFAAQPR